MRPDEIRAWMAKQRFSAQVQQALATARAAANLPQALLAPTSRTDQPRQHKP